ncbi:MAG: J domain-containing protein [Oscillospiraceae bacterium]|nr:J domain-containing protein [Oscillospiraceae bacterium]
MSNPYEILGIPQNADEATLREAYRGLARAYEGDARRMRELDEAYDAVILSRGQVRGQEAGYREQGGFGDIRRQLQAGRYDDALTLLDGMPPPLRTAEWYYLKGCAQRGRGWLEEAERNFAQGCRMDPGNGEYRAAYDRAREDRGGKSRGHDENGGECCKICAGLACIDCLCECCR